MTTLYLSLFGGVTLKHGVDGTEVRVSNKTGHLLAYLLLNRQQYHPRSRLAALFWGGQSEKKASHSLRTALWRLRQMLEPEGVAQETYLVASADDVRFNTNSNYRLDIEEFEQAVKHNDIAIQKHAITLFQANLLAELFDEWVIWERERLTHLYIQTLTRLMHNYQAQSDWTSAIECGRQILHHDCLREDIHRIMMQLYNANGQRPLAVRQYQICSQQLQDELGLWPMAETRNVYSSLFSHDENEQMVRPPLTVVEGINHIIDDLVALRHKFIVSV